MDMRGDQEIARRLGGAVGRGGVERRLLRERPGRDRPVDLVGGDLHEAADAVLAGRVQEHTGPDHVRSGERLLVLDRAVHVGLRGEVDDRVAAAGRARDVVGLGDVALEELDLLQRQVGAVAGIGELVEHDDLLAGGEEALDEVRADEAGAAGDEDAHREKVSRLGPSVEATAPEVEPRLLTLLLTLTSRLPLSRRASHSGRGAVSGTRLVSSVSSTDEACLVP